MHLQETAAGAPLGKLNVSPKTMEGLCITMVTPHYPQISAEAVATSVLVRVVIWKSGSVTPMEVISGPPALRDEAMNSLRLWKFKPFFRDGDPVDVTTELRVAFDPGKPGGVVTHPTR